MERIEQLIREAYTRQRKAYIRRSAPPSDEEIACYHTGLLSGKERDRLLRKSFFAAGDESKKYSFLLTDDMAPSTGTQVPPRAIKKAKGLMPETGEEDMLWVVIGYAGDLFRVIESTGRIITRGMESDIIPAAAYRGDDAFREKCVKLSKTVQGYVIHITIERIGADRANLSVYITGARNGMPLSGQRISLITPDGKELRSSLSDRGKVDFHNVALREYRIHLVRNGDSRCIATIALTPLSS